MACYGIRRWQKEKQKNFFFSSHRFISMMLDADDDDEMRKKSSKQFLCDGTLCEGRQKGIVLFFFCDN